MRIWSWTKENNKLSVSASKSLIKCITINILKHTSVLYSLDYKKLLEDNIKKLLGKHQHYSNIKLDIFSTKNDFLNHLRSSFYHKKFDMQTPHIAMCTYQNHTCHKKTILFLKKLATDGV